MKALLILTVCAAVVQAENRDWGAVGIPIGVGSGFAAYPTIYRK